ncbi:DUF547 domain-containing protein [Sessilibacter sp. MAH4]
MNTSRINFYSKFFVFISGIILLFNSVFAFSEDKKSFSASDYQAAMQSWAQLLNTHVDEQGRIDFRTIAENPQSLSAIVEVIENYGPQTNPSDFTQTNAILAYHINAYNALAMNGVIERGIPKGFTSTLKRASFFVLRSVVVDGKKTNLYQYENKVIRPLGEPRVHFALNCMVKDCPRLPQQPFSAEHLDKELDAAAHEFFDKPVHFRLDSETKRAYVSEILKFYTEDFVESGKKKDLPIYINQYLSEKIPQDYKVSFIDYDWHINQQP